jgi:hypothetical protein
MTWEPASNLDGASDTIADFHLRYPDKPSTDRPKKPPGRGKRK